MSALVAVVAGLAVGVVLGLLGAGGSLLTVPALAVLLGLSAVEATGTSLLVVSAMAATGLVVHRRAGRCSCRHGLQFASVGVLTAAGAGWFADAIPDPVIAAAFAVLLIGTAAWFALHQPAEETAPGGDTIRRSGSDQLAGDPHHHHGEVRTGRVVLAGAGVGVLTGLLGVGGGFVVVPALAATLGLSAPVAIGTSQLVILANALAGIAGRSLGTTSIVWATGLLFAVGGVAGAAAGSVLTDRFSPKSLRYGFAAVAAAAASAMIIDVL